MGNQGEEWREPTKTFFNKITDLLNSDNLSDITFKVGADRGEIKEFFAHKFVLGVESPVFEAMFLRDLAEKQRVISIPDVTPQGFFALLRYIYTEIVLIDSVMDALETFYAARKYLVPLLQDQCERYIIFNMTPKTACRVYEFATMMDLHAVVYKCLRLFDEEIHEVLRSLDFKTSQLFTLQTIVKRPFLTAISEINIFKAVMAWAREECVRKGVKQTGTELRCILNPLLPDIRFLNMTSYEFTNNVLELNILTQEEAYAILVKLVKPKTNIVKMPYPFYNIRKPRMPMTNCSIQTHEMGSKAPVKQVDGDDQFLLRFQLKRKDIFLIGIAIPIMLLGRCYEPPYVSLATNCRCLDTGRSLIDFNFSITPNSFKDAIVTFPCPVLIRKEDSIEISVKVISLKFHPFVYVYTYDIKKERVEWGDAEFVLSDQPSDIAVHEIGSLQIYY